MGLCSVAQRADNKMSASSNNKSKTQRPPTASIGKSLGDTARKAKSAAKRTAKRTIDDVAMTPFLARSFSFRVADRFWMVMCLRSLVCVNAGYASL